jgi:small-conductance mechanosensitive channel
MAVLETLGSGEIRLLAAILVLVGGLILGFLVGKLNVRVLESLGVPAAVEGTTVERTARKFGTSTVSIIGRLTSWIIYLVALLVSLEVTGYIGSVLFLLQAGNVIPNLVLGALIVFIGLLVADKAELLVSESLRSVKLPEIGVIPTLVRYTIVFAALLVGLAQVGVSVTVLIVLFGAYVFAIVVVTVVAFRQLLASAAAGIYLLLNQPYSIGDRVSIDEKDGVVQEVDVFVTRIEADGREYIVPNHLVLTEGAILIRD